MGRGASAQLETQQADGEISCGLLLSLSASDSGADNCPQAMDSSVDAGGSSVQAAIGTLQHWDSRGEVKLGRSTVVHRPAVRPVDDLHWPWQVCFGLPATQGFDRPALMDLEGCATLGFAWKPHQSCLML